MYKDWKARSSIRRITLIDSKNYRSPVTEEVLRVLLDTLEIEPVIRTFRGEDTSAFLRDLYRVKTSGIIFPASGLASMFAFRSPDKLADLLRGHRVAFIDGPIDMPFATIPEVAVDLVTVNWQTVAESIVNDLITREAFDHNRSATFEAEAQLRVPLSSFSEEIHPSQGMAASI